VRLPAGNRIAVDHRMLVCDGRTSGQGGAPASHSRQQQVSSQPASALPHPLSSFTSGDLTKTWLMPVDRLYRKQASLSAKTP